MSWQRRLRLGVKRAFSRFGISIGRINPEERRYLASPYDNRLPLPPGAVDVLRDDNPRLIELRQAYADLDFPVCTHSVWRPKKLSGDLELAWFRGDNAYVWQHRQMRSNIRLRQYLALRDIETRDQLGLLERLEEDGLFGCWTFQYGRRPPISRDLLESINEINFLHRQLGIANRKNLSVLDIGAGYGRLAHRMCQALPNLVRYDCVDAVPESTFLCEYYLDFRGVNERAQAVPLHLLQRLAPPGAYDLAVNIHSFSECTLAAVRWWLQRLVKLKVPYLLVVPNAPEELLTVEPDGRRLDFAPDVEAVGYHLIHKAPVYADDELRELIGIRDHFFLFGLRDN